MFPSSQDNPKNRTLFSIFGPVYIPEDHAEQDQVKLSKIHWPDAGAVGIWVVAYVVFVAVAVLTSGGAGKLVALAAAALK